MTLLLVFGALHTFCARASSVAVQTSNTTTAFNATLSTLGSKIAHSSGTLEQLIVQTNTNSDATLSSNSSLPILIVPSPTLFTTVMIRANSTSTAQDATVLAAQPVVTSAQPSTVSNATQIDAAQGRTSSTSIGQTTPPNATAVHIQDVVQYNVSSHQVISEQVAASSATVGAIATTSSAAGNALTNIHSQQSSTNITSNTTEASAVSSGGGGSIDAGKKTKKKEKKPGFFERLFGKKKKKKAEEGDTKSETKTTDTKESTKTVKESKNKQSKKTGFFEGLFGKKKKTDEH